MMTEHQTTAAPIGLVDDAIAVQERCFLGLHRWALCGVVMPEGYLKLTGGEICLDCHERKPFDINREAAA